MHKEVKRFIKELEKRDEMKLAGTYDRYVHILHGDGSEFKIMHASVGQYVVTCKSGLRNPIEFKIAVVFSEHNGVIPFYEGDLEFIKVKPWKGRERKLKIITDL